MDILVLILGVTIISFVCFRYSGMTKLTLLLFNAVWFGALFLSQLSLFGWNKLTTTSTWIFISYIAVFNITYIVSFNNTTKPKNRTGSSNISISDSIRLKLLICAHFVVYIICFPYIGKAINIITQLGPWYMRHYVYTPSDLYFETSLIASFFQWVIQPFFQFVLLIMASQLFNRNKNRILYIFAIVDLLLELLLFGAGRRTIIVFLLAIVAFFYLSRKKSGFGKIVIESKRLKTIGIMIVIVVVFILLTVRRIGGVYTDFIKSSLQYFVGPILFFDSCIGSNVGNVLSMIPKMGELTFSFITVPMSLLSRLFNVGGWENAALELTSILNEQVCIGANSFHNAHATSIMYFYLDFGGAFAWLGAVFMGLVTAYFTKNYYKSNRSFLLGVYFFTLVFYSAQTYPFATIVPAMMCIFSCVFIKEKV